ncbi:MAG: hypothetical protein JWQ40_3 [Segetibacter sp.]|nr:hypothetical protein [Segetibacter sp.]
MKIFIPCLFLLFGCSKKPEDVKPPIEPTTLTLSTTSVVPGEAVVIRLDKKITAKEVQIVVNSISVKGYANGDSSYVLFMPAAVPGNISVSIPGIENSNTLSLTVKNYSPITDAQAVIKEFVDKRNRSIDSITKSVVGNNYVPSQESTIFLNQVKEEWDVQMSKLTPADKELLAYVLQNKMLNPSSYSFSSLPEPYTARTSAAQRDAGDILVDKAKAFVLTVNGCVATIPAVLISGGAFLYAPNPITAIIFLGSLTAYVVLKELSARRGAEVGNLPGIAEAIEGTELQRAATVVFNNNTERALSMSVNFRNIATGDAGINSNISAAISGDNDLKIKDQELKNLYNKVADKTEKLKGSYPSYLGLIGKQGQGKIVLSVIGTNILVKGVSDSRINVTTSVSGKNRKVKISSTATTDINFTLKTAYVRKLDGKEFTQDIACLFKPAIDSTSIYQASAIGKYTVNGFVGNGPNSKLYCELKAGGAAVYTIYDDPSWPNGHTFSAGWTIHKINNQYLITTSFTNPGHLLNEANPLSYPVTNFVYRHSYVK